MKKYTNETAVDKDMEFANEIITQKRNKEKKTNTTNILYKIYRNSHWMHDKMANNK